MEEYVNIALEYNSLTQDDVQQRIEMYGYNREKKETPHKEKHFGIGKLFLSARLYLMLISAVLMFFNGEIAFGVVMVVLLAFYIATEIFILNYCQVGSKKTNRTSEVKVRAMRDGELAFIDKKYLVPDDIVLLQAGESVPADIHLLEVEDLAVDEFLFSQDHAPVAKTVGVDNKNELKQTCLYKGTRLVGGSCVGRVTATGVDTLKYKTFGETAEENSFYTGFEEIIGRILPVFTILSIVALVALALFSFMQDNSTEVVPLLYNVFMPAVSFALCFLPAETSRIVRIYYLTAAKKIQNKNLAIKNINVMDSLNAMTTVCIDKTGVVTKSRIELTEEYSKNTQMLGNISIMSCDVTPKSPYDKAVVINAGFKHIDVKELQENRLVKAFPYAEDEQIGGNLWEVNGSMLMCIKGIPEKVFSFSKMQYDQLSAYQEKQVSLSRQGQVVMAVAYARLEDGEKIPDSLYELEYTVVGLIAFSNQTRDTIPVAVRDCYKAGVNVIMTTSDSVEAAKAIAYKIGMIDGGVVTGEQLRAAKRSGEPLDISGANVFARISQDQKTEIVDLLQESGEVVGTISDSNTDIALLEASSVGIARMQSSASVQETADVLLGDDDFRNFVNLVKETRQIHSNAKKCISMSLSVTIVLAMFFFLNLILPSPQVMSPILSSVIFVVFTPLILLAFNNNRIDVKNSKAPSSFIRSGVISRHFVPRALLQAAGMLVAMLVAFFISVGYSVEMARSAVMITFLASLVGMMLVNLSDEVSSFTALLRSRNAGSIESGVAFAVALLMIYLPFLNKWLGFTSLNIFILLLCIVIGVAGQVWFDLLKRSSFFRGTAKRKKLPIIKPEEQSEEIEAE